MDILDIIVTPEVASIIITALLLPVIKGIATYITTYIAVKVEDLREKVRNDKVEHYMRVAEDAVITSVESVAQTFVDNLRLGGGFDDESKREAFILAKDKALKMIGSEGRKIIEEVSGDINIWIENKIESIVRNSKD
jgi:hypothetical protein